MAPVGCVCWRCEVERLEAQCCHRSHFGSRYTLGCCACAGLFCTRVRTPPLVHAVDCKQRSTLGLVQQHGTAEHTHTTGARRAPRQTHAYMHGTPWRRQCVCARLRALGCCCFPGGGGRSMSVCCQARPSTIQGLTAPATNCTIKGGCTSGVRGARGLRGMTRWFPMHTVCAR